MQKTIEGVDPVLASNPSNNMLKPPRLRLTNSLQFSIYKGGIEKNHTPVQQTHLIDTNKFSTSEV
jgi:hypothetical protein